MWIVKPESRITEFFNEYVEVEKAAFRGKFSVKNSDSTLPMLLNRS